MLCYKDKTFCHWSGCCANKSCLRWLDAGEAYQSGLPVALSDFRTEDCGFIPTEHYKQILKEQKEQ